MLVEFWATWCSPCRSTLQWLGELKKKHGEHIAVVALAGSDSLYFCGRDSGGTIPATRQYATSWP